MLSRTEIKGALLGPALVGLLAFAPSLALADDSAPQGVAPQGADLSAMDGIAADDDDDALDDILNEGTSTKDEIDAVRSGDLDDNIGSKNEDVVLPEDELRKKRLIKTLQRKTFLKLGRVEAGPHIGAVANDPFLRRYILGGTVAYHLTEVFALEADLGWSPDLGDSVDHKPLTTQLVEENNVSPDISKLSYYGTLTFAFSPIYGKVAVGTRIINFDIFGVFGAGVARTADDLYALQAEDNDVRALASAEEFHPTTNLGGGLRIVFNPNLALRLEGRSLVYIETVQSTTLEMKNNLIVQGTFTFFVPGIKS